MAFSWTRALPMAALLAGLFHSAEAARKPLFKRSAGAAGPDTLEVFVLYVEFRDETDKDDEPGTTGRGIFGSDKDTSYSLDPNGSSLRRSRHYLEKHFEFANNYFRQVSGGQVVIETRLFPAPDGEDLITITPANRLSRRMKAYNPALEDKREKQKIAEFEKERAMALMSFVSEAAELYHKEDSLKNPFYVAIKEAMANPSPTRHRAFLIFHAGHSRLIDGGTLGYLGANTPNDFTDFFVTKEDFRFLDSATKNFRVGGEPDTARRRDSLGVRLSLRIGNQTVDTTITEFMMLSEAASQEKTNWGINGILINQLGRQMGMPDLFDIVKGISQVGYFDVMDFAGYNTLSGFLPVFPSAWTRAFMGWDQPVLAKPDSGPFSEYRLHAADRPGAGRTRTLKVPLNEREYLLVENRQRAAGDSQVTIYFSTRENATDFRFSKSDSVKVRYSFIDSVLLDSACAEWSGKSCKKKKKNDLKPSGIITGASHYDMGLPGNGLLVWHVNEWFLETFLREGAVNAWLGDTLRAQYKGLELVEADGILSIGKEFTDPLGQPAFDYGTAQDLLPHIYRRQKNLPRDTNWSRPETLSVIGSYGFANTNSWNDGRTHIRLEARLPSSPLLAPAIGGFTGDSVFTVRDSALTLRVHWPDNGTVKRPPGSTWPVRTAAAAHFQALNVVKDGNGGGPYVVSVSDAGELQTYAASGSPALAARDTAKDTGNYAGVRSLLSSGNTRPENAAPVNSLVDPVGAPLGACVARDSVLAVLTSSSLRILHPERDSLNGQARSGARETVIPLSGKAGPMAWDNRIYVVAGNALRSFDPDGSSADSIPLPARDYHSLAGVFFGSGRAPQVIVAGAGGAALRVDPSSRQAVDLRPAWGSLAPPGGETFTVSVSDFDRDGNDDALLLGSRGSALLFHLRADRQGQAFAGFPQRFARSVSILDTAGKTYQTQDGTPPALADLDRDGHPDFLFAGTNAILAVNWRGAFLPGWPFLPQPRQSIGFTYGNRRRPETVIGSSPLVLSLRGRLSILVGTPDGLIYGVDSAAKPLTHSSFAPDPRTGVLMSNRSDWPLSVGGLSIDSLRAPYVHLSLAQLDTGNLELLAQTASGSLSAWSLASASAAPGADWLMPGGDAARSQRLEASALGSPRTAQDREAIEEFHLFPSPVRGGLATVHLKLGAAADKARIRVFDLAGKPVKEQSFASLAPGLQPFDKVLDLRHLGPDVYAVLCEVWFPGGKKQKWQRVGVVR